MLYTCINIRIFDRFDLYINDLILNQMFFFYFHNNFDLPSHILKRVSKLVFIKNNYKQQCYSGCHS